MVKLKFILLFCNFQDDVSKYAPNMVAGMLALFRYCPQEVAHLRKELLIAARHILATELRSSELKWLTYILHITNMILFGEFRILRIYVVVFWLYFTE